MFRYTHCIKDVLLAKIQAIFREKLEALLFYFLDTIPNRWVFAVQEAMFEESLFRDLYGGDGGFHRGLVVCFCVKRQRRSKGIKTQLHSLACCHFLILGAGGAPVVG